MDEGIFVCVLSPIGIIGDIEIGTDHDLDAKDMAPEEEASDAGNIIW